MQVVNVLLFDDFTTIDAFGPAEVLGRLRENFRIVFVSMDGGLIAGSAGTIVSTRTVNEVKDYDIFLLPGGFGTRNLVDDVDFINRVKTFAEKSQDVLSVCTGSALLAKAGVIRNLRATSNKIAWDWVVQQDPEVNWIRKARWTVDGKFYTSSGITAGIDMALGFIADRFDVETARRISKSIEYIWNEDKDEDPFA